MDISNKDKAAVLAALFNHAKSHGRGVQHCDPSSVMSTSRAQELLSNTQSKYFDYIGGRIIKVDLSGDTFDTWLYDRDNGEGAAAKAIASIP